MEPHRTVRVLVSHRQPVVRAGVVATLNQIPWLRVLQQADAASPADILVCDYETGIAHPPGRPPQAVLVVTHRESEGDVRRALDSGIGGYLVLGDPLEHLAAAVIDLATGRRYLSQSVAGRVVDSLLASPLTQRETEVLHLAAQGASNKVIAARLNITVATVKVHMRSVLDKLGTSNRTQAAAVAQRRGLLPPLAAAVAT